MGGRRWFRGCCLGKDALRCRRRLVWDAKSGRRSAEMRGIYVGRIRTVLSRGLHPYSSFQGLFVACWPVHHFFLPSQAFGVPCGMWDKGQ